MSQFPFFFNLMDDDDNNNDDKGDNHSSLGFGLILYILSQPTNSGTIDGQSLVLRRGPPACYLGNSLVCYKPRLPCSSYTSLHFGKVS